MIAVEFHDEDTTMGWYAFPQVPGKGEFIKLPGIYTAEVMGVLWEWTEVPRAVVNMRDAGLASAYSDDKKLIARVRLHLIERRDEEE